MPLFEFVCNNCERPFEELVRSTGAIAEVTCPNCGSPQVKKKLSTFASRASGSSFSFGSASSSAASCGSGST